MTLHCEVQSVHSLCQINKLTYLLTYDLRLQQQVEIYVIAYALNLLSRRYIVNNFNLYNSTDKPKKIVKSLRGTFL